MKKINSPKKPGLNCWMLTALVTGTMVGSGIFTLPANLATYGSISLVAWGLTALGAILLAFLFAKLSIIMPKTGGPYTYCRAAFGDFVGFQVAYNYWFSLWVGNAAITVTCAGYLAALFPVLQHDMWLSFAVKAGIVWLFTGINLLGTRNASIMQIITTVLKLLPLFIIGCCGLFVIHWDHFNNFNISGQSNLSALGTTATLTLWSFIGLEAATVPADDAEQKNYIARATIIGTLLAAFVDVLCIVVLMGLIPMRELAQSTAPFVEAATLLFPHYSHCLTELVAGGAIISCLGALNSTLLLQGQIPKAAAQDGLFPAIFTPSNAAGTPAFALIFSSLLITIVLLMTISNNLLHQFEILVLMATFASLVPYLITALSTLKLIPACSKKLVAIVITASVYSVWAIASSGLTIILFGGLLFLSGLPIYFYTRHRARK